jgi:hypothetical protein
MTGGLVLNHFQEMAAHYDWRWGAFAALIGFVGVLIAFKLLADAFTLGPEGPCLR